jgi:hypothetical protein
MPILPPDQLRTIGALSTVGLSFVIAILLPGAGCRDPQRLPGHAALSVIADPDPLLRRLQTGALVWCAGLVAAALALFPDRPAIAGGIAGGGLLTAVSFYAISSSIDALLAVMGPAAAAPGSGGDGAGPAPPETRRNAGAALLKLAGRYALLGLLAYVMIARLRLHPVGLIVGASSLVAAAGFEAVRGLARPAPRPRDR